jgi:hypothetical protein
MLVFRIAHKPHSNAPELPRLEARKGTRVPIIKCKKVTFFIYKFIKSRLGSGIIGTKDNVRKILPSNRQVLNCQVFGQEQLVNIYMDVPSPGDISPADAPG